VGSQQIGEGLDEGDHDQNRMNFVGNCVIVRLRSLRRSKVLQMEWGSYLFGFRGRINRAKYWLWVLLYFSVALGLGLITFAINLPLVNVIVELVFLVLVVFTNLAVTAKRLHDRNKSAWWLLIFALGPGVVAGLGLGLIVSASDISGSGAASSGNSVAIVIGWLAMVVAIVLALWAFVELACLRGSIGPNRYGPDPLEGRL
jgi:uncharacterized membrane protein YhaH (DUF805 family)